MDTPNPTQWEADFAADLTLPPELTATQRYKFTAGPPLNLHGTCAEYVLVEGVIVMRDCLLDTSQRVHNVTLTHRVTYRTECVLAGGPVVLVRLHDDERR